MMALKSFTLLISVIFLTISFKISAQTVFELNGEYKYILPSAEPDTNWRKIDFNDDAWTNGFKSIGYGDKDDSTQLNGPITSIFLRIKFNISNKSRIKCANFFADFDDGFVAYLNGKEIARMNLGARDEKIPFNSLAIKSHEAYLYRMYLEPNGIYLDSTTLSECLVEGTNVISVQVHNDSINGSDLTFNGNLYTFQPDEYDIYARSAVQYRIFPFRSLKQEKIVSSKLPLVYINTDEFGFPAAHTGYVAKMGIVNNGPGKLNLASDTFTDYYGRILIKIRGNISDELPKKSFRLETQDNAGNNVDMPLLGMPSDNDWILYGPFYDKTLIRNELAFILGRKMGYYEPRTRYCELIVNGEYQGIYVLMENIKRGKNRINISKLSTTDNYGVAVTGGYIINAIQTIVYPKPDEITTNQSQYIRNFLNNFYAVLNTADFLDPKYGYKKYIDEQSMIDYVIANEIFKNCDSYAGSTYFYKDRDDKDGRIKYGPLWDNDLAFGNAPDSWQSAARTTGWQYEISGGLRASYIFRDTNVVNQFIDKWFKLRKSFLNTDSLFSVIDSLAKYIESSRIKNYEVWPVINKDFYVSYGGAGTCFSTTYEGAISNLKNWLEQRLTWIDENIEKIYYPNTAKIITPEIAGKKDNFFVYPNPFKEELNIECSIDKPSSYSFEISDLSGRLVATQHGIRFNEGSNNFKINSSSVIKLAKGVYLMAIYSDGKLIQKEKIVKQ